MCGICGVLDLTGAHVERETLIKMTNAIAHRGPDGEGWFLDGSLGLGHRRLAIVDLSPAGQQPMTAANGRFVISYNGEVYNHPELRSELESKGHRFNSRSDTEVVLNAWLEWGTDSITRLNGMFAFAVWDTRAGELTLVRDKYGIKPLYYAMFGRHFVFGSEQRAILQYPSATRQLDKRALVEYLTFQNIISDRTLNEVIKILPAGNFLRVNKESAEPVIRQYWDFCFEDGSPDPDPKALEEELTALIRQAVKRQLRSDVEVGAYLSGGLDSGTLAALAAQDFPNLRTFTCGFDTSNATPEEVQFDERLAARGMAEFLGVTHHEIVVGPREFESSLDIVVRQLEEPRVGQSYPNYLVAQLAARHVKVVLSGAGGDELFGGYPWRYLPAFDSADESSFMDRYFQYWNRLMSPAQVKRLLEPIWDEVADYDVRELFDNVIRGHGISEPEAGSYLNSCLYFEAKTFLHGLLVVEDKLSMAHGLETRLPFLDDEVVNFAMKCPSGLKVTAGLDSKPSKPTETNSGAMQLLQGKQILRRVLQEIVGDSMVAIRKQGFSAPDSSWFANQSKDFVETRLRKTVLPEECVPSFAVAKEVLNSHTPWSGKYRLLMWSLLNLQILCGGSVQ